MPFDELGWEPPEITPALTSLIDQVRADEAALRKTLRALSAVQQETLVRTMIVGADGDACEPPLDLRQAIDEMCEACLTVRGPLDRGDDRRALRERARIHLRLATGPHALRNAGDLLALWDEATRREPCIRLFVNEPRWRTREDGVPFTGARWVPVFDLLPLEPGRETADPPDIPRFVEIAVDFAQRDDLPPEAVAFSMPYLIFRIHPFMDGNGHTLRMLTCDILHRTGYSEQTLLSYIDAIYARHDEMCDVAVDVALGKASMQDHIAFHLELLQEAQKSARSSADPARFLSINSEGGSLCT